ncbi:MAG: hypothetical protein CFE34_14735 [Rhodobacteraceae bacterium PARR1]|nr:MAG: hypothetical protein CFE34_14735 [Rhodobacteraceae bacterium PARR1]
MATRRCLFVSCHGADLRPWNGVPFEFFSVLSQIEDVTLAAPQGRASLCNAEPDDETLYAEVKLRLQRRIRRKVAGSHTPILRPTRLHQDYDLTVYICQFLEDVQEINQIEGWRERSGVAVIFLLESWTSTFDTYKAEMAVLSRFDHVFILNGSALEPMRRRVSAPISQLSTACDTLLAAPIHRQPDRSIDMVCFGRWNDSDHKDLVRYARREGLFYYHDIWVGLRAIDWAAVRRRNAELIQRAQFYLVWAPNAWHQKWRDGTGQDHALSTRYFEGAAGGAVVIGSRPACPEFDAAFDWPDALVPLGDDPGATVQALRDDPMRMDRIRRDNILHALRRHDWAHRWAAMLTVLGLPLTEAHRTRLARLALLAAQMEPAPVWGGLHVVKGESA